MYIIEWKFFFILVYFILITWPKTVVCCVRILFTSALDVWASFSTVSFDVLAIHDIFIILLRNHISNASSFFCACLDIVQALQQRETTREDDRWTCQLAGSRQGGWNPESNKGPWNMEGHDRQRYKAWHRMMMMIFHSRVKLENILDPSKRLTKKTKHSRLSPELNSFVPLNQRKAHSG